MLVGFIPRIWPDLLGKADQPRTISELVFTIYVLVGQHESLWIDFTSGLAWMCKAN